MIELSRLNGQRFVVNAELIRTVEETPDTLLTLITGDRLVVRESMKEVVARSVAYGRSLRRLIGPEPGGGRAEGESTAAARGAA